jgi:hypothetical protein
LTRWTIGGLAYLVALAIVVRVSAELLTPALPLLIILLGIAIVFRKLWRGF